MRLRIDLPRRADLFAHLRDLVERGEPDGPADVYRDGRLSVVVSSIYRAACLTVAEEPSPRFVPYSPHPKAQIGPRVAALLAAYRAERELRRAALMRAKKDSDNAR